MNKSDAIIARTGLGQRRYSTCTWQRYATRSAVLKKRWRPGLTRDEGLRVAVEALIEAAEDDVATGGPDLARGIFPVVMTVTSEGATESTDEEVASAVRAVVETRP